MEKAGQWYKQMRAQPPQMGNKLGENHLTYLDMQEIQIKMTLKLHFSARWLHKSLKENI